MTLVIPAPFPQGSTGKSLGTADAFKMTKFAAVPPRVFDGIDWAYPPQRDGHDAFNQTQASLQESGELNTVD